MKIRQAHVEDAAAISLLYNRFVLETNVSFETDPVSAEQMAGRIEEKLNHFDWLVAEQEGELLGYAYYGQFRSRAAYNGTVEASVYMASQATGRGLATELYGAVLVSARDGGFSQAIGVITVPNDKSEALHRRLGFEPVGVLRGVGRKFDQDADVALWQLRLKDFTLPTK